MRLFVSDLDGTLLNRDFKISRENVDAIRGLEAAGIAFAVATGRIYTDARAICDTYSLNPYIISNNGACVFSDQAELISGTWIKSGDVERIAEFLRKLDVCFCLGSSRELVVLEEWRDIYLGEIAKLKETGVQVFEEKVKFTMEEMLSQKGLLEAADWEQLLDRGKPCCSISVITHDRRKVQDIQAYIAGMEYLTTSVSGAHNLEIMSAAGSKALAVEHLAAFLGIGADRIIAIGDGFNDKEMIEKAGLGIAMSNAPEEVKRVSLYVTRSCPENGVAHAIKQLKDLVE